MENGEICDRKLRLTQSLFGYITRPCIFDNRINIRKLAPYGNPHGPPKRRSDILRARGVRAGRPVRESRSIVVARPREFLNTVGSAAREFERALYTDNGGKRFFVGSSV